MGAIRNYLRHMRTTQERRRGEADADRGVPPWPCRNAHRDALRFVRIGLFGLYLLLLQYDRLGLPGLVG